MASVVEQKAEINVNHLPDEIWRTIVRLDESEFVRLPVKARSLTKSESPLRCSTGTTMLVRALPPIEVSDGFGDYGFGGVRQPAATFPHPRCARQQ